MAEPGSSRNDLDQRPHKRPKAAAPIDRGPDLNADALLKYRVKLPQEFTPASVQANRVSLRVHGGDCKAYVANAQHVYEVSLGADLVNAASAADWSSELAVDKGKEGVLVPRNAQVGHIRQVPQLSDMAAEIQGLSSLQQGHHHILAAVDAIGNARLLASPVAVAPDAGAGAGADASSCGSGEDGERGHSHVLELPARTRGECGWVGLAMRWAGPGGGSDGGAAGGGGLPRLEVAVARQQTRDVAVFLEGVLVRTLHTLQGPTAVAYLPPGPYGGCADATSGLLAVAEDHQVALWDIRQGERGGCVQRLNVYGGGSPVYGLCWVPGVSAQQQSGAGGGEGLLAVTGGERSVVMLEPRKWHVAAKWAGCAKYPATHLVRSAAAPGFVYVAGLDYECVGGRWDGSCGGSSGNANSSSGGHGRAVGPAHLLAAAAARERDAAGAGAGEDAAEAGPRGGLSFRGDSKWLGLATIQLPQAAPDGTAAGGGGSGGRPVRELLAALSMSGHLYVLASSASAPATAAQGKEDEAAA